MNNDDTDQEIGRITWVDRDRKDKSAVALSSSLTRGLRLSIKKARPAGLFSLVDLACRLLAETSRRDVTAVSTDDSAGYGIIVTSSGTESAAKEIVGFESACDLLKFFFTHKAGASPAKYAICFM
jgi:hypothetical protein